MALDVLIRSITREAAEIHSFELVPLEGELPAFTAGAHIDVHLPGGMTRQYSLHNRPGETHRYLISVLRLPTGRGGSAAMHKLMVGQTLSISPPRNHFELVEHAPQYILIAGGIGITPLLPMAERLDQLGASYQLHYYCRERMSAAFVHSLEMQEAGGKVQIHCDGGVPPHGLPVASLLGAARPGAHVYCCGPTGLMKAVRDATRHWPTGSIHFESFSMPPTAAPEVPSAAGEFEFEIQLASDSRVVGVSKGQSMLQALRRAGVEIDSSCEAGTCGTCKTAYLSGTPDHQDFILGENEQDRFLMVCVSRCKSKRIVLDL